MPAAADRAEVRDAEGIVPVAEEYWPDWLEEEVERSAELGLKFG